VINGLTLGGIGRDGEGRVRRVVDWVSAGRACCRHLLHIDGLSAERARARIGRRIDILTSGYGGGG
jgi:hypothetical protein